MQSKHRKKNIAHRAKEICVHDFGDNESAMAREIGWGQSRLHRALSLETKTLDPYEELAEKISMHLGYALDALTGSTPLHDEQANGSAREVLAVEEGGGTEKEDVAVPVFGDVSCGPGLIAPDDVKEYERMKRYAFERVFGVSAHRIESGRYGFWRVQGDSAAPVYFENELVPVEVVGPTQEFASERLYVFRWQGSVLLKRLIMQANGRVRALSLNPAIKGFDFEPHDGHGFVVLGRVIQNEKQQLYAALLGKTLLS